MTPKGYPMLICLVLLLTTIISGCSVLQRQVILTNECSWYTPIKIQCVDIEKRKALGISEGVKCSDIISRETKEQVQVLNLVYQKSCLH